MAGAHHHVPLAMAVAGATPAMYVAAELCSRRLADPVGALISITGRASLAFLLLSLVPTAIRHITGSTAAMPWRRGLGLAACAYALAHTIAYLALGYGMRLGEWLSALPQDRFVIPGLVALLVLVMLAATSGRRAMMRLGPWWQRLHRLVYVAAILATIHYAAAFKELRRAPLLAGAALLALFVVRLPPVWRALERARRRA